MPTGHLVPDGKLPPLGNIDLDQLDDPRRQLVSTHQAFNLTLGLLFDELGLLGGETQQSINLIVERLVVGPAGLGRGG